jgi:hypothetical protein
MLMDYNAQFSDNQSIVSTASIDSTNVLDFETADANTGAGVPIWVICRVHTAFTGSGTLAVVLKTCDTSGGTYVTRFTTVGYSLLETDVAGDDLLVIPLPQEHQRYMKLTYTNGHNSGAAGAVDAYLSTNDPINKKTW